MFLHIKGKKNEETAAKKYFNKSKGNIFDPAVVTSLHSTSMCAFNTSLEKKPGLSLKTKEDTLVNVRLSVEIKYIQSIARNCFM